MNFNSSLKSISFIILGIISLILVSVFNSKFLQVKKKPYGIINGVKTSENYFDKEIDTIHYLPERKYQNHVSTKKRFLTCGFDDFRPSDFSWVSPLFSKYDYRATFNKINHKFPDQEELEKINKLLKQGHEIGDHTILHEMLIYYSPLFNGQDPKQPDGNQKEFPTNDDLRKDRGDGKNIFGRHLTDTFNMGYNPPIFGEPKPTWENLSNEHCQIIRNHYSVLKNSSLIEYLDLLSNKYLGTTGSSVGSWEKDKYTHGIYTNSRTSANHEIWERICQIQKIFYFEQYKIPYEIKEWSLPGSKNAYLFFEKNGLFYYDREKTQLANDFGKFQSSIYYDNKTKRPLNRSWIDVLRSYGYRSFHDALYPGRVDRLYTSSLSYPLMINASFSRNDAMPYSTIRNVVWGKPAFSKEYAQSENIIQKMYEDSSFNDFYNTVENIRHAGAQGIICGSVWDSQNNDSEKLYWETILKFCKKSNIELITKSEAFDLCFNQTITQGNLLYNPNFENTIENILPNSKKVPAQPDGWFGECYVIKPRYVDTFAKAVLKIPHGFAYTKHFGIPTELLSFEFEASGYGNIEFFYIRNKQDVKSVPKIEDKISNIYIGSNDFCRQKIMFNIPNHLSIKTSFPFDGLDDKITGILIKISGTNIMLTKPSLTIKRFYNLNFN